MDLILSGAGHQTRTCDDTRRAIELNREDPADVLITDIFMPGVDGLETISEFRALWPNLKIVAMSGGGNISKRDYLSVAMKVGADAMVRKPFEPKALLELVLQLVPRKP